MVLYLEIFYHLSEYPKALTFQKHVYFYSYPCPTYLWTSCYRLQQVQSHPRHYICQMVQHVLDRHAEARDEQRVQLTCGLPQECVRHVRCHYRTEELHGHAHTQQERRGHHARKQGDEKGEANVHAVP